MSCELGLFFKREFLVLIYLQYQNVLPFAIGNTFLLFMILCLFKKYKININLRRGRAVTMYVYIVLCTANIRTAR